MSERELRRLRRRMQIVFQDPHASLNPAMTIEQSVGHPLEIHGIAKGAERRRRVAEALETVGLSPPEQFIDKYPSDLSGGQKQRAVIARAIILNPVLLVADEPVSMLDMSVRAKILELMLNLKHEFGFTYLYITHDLATAKFFCDRIAILYLGRIVEMGPSEAIYEDPKHPYTKALLRAIPGARSAPQRSARSPAWRGSRRRATAARMLVPPALPGRVRGVRLGESRSPRPARDALGPDGGGRVRERAGRARGSLRAGRRGDLVPARSRGRPQRCGDVVGAPRACSRGRSRRAVLARAFGAIAPATATSTSSSTSRIAPTAVAGERRPGRVQPLRRERAPPARRARRVAEN